MLAIRLPPAIEKRLEKLARRTGRTKTYYVREAILEHLQDLEDMRLAERALELMVIRSLERSTFGTSLAQKGLIQDWIAESRIEIDMAREYVLKTAHLMDTVGNKAAATQISSRSPSPT